MNIPPALQEVCTQIHTSPADKLTDIRSLDAERFRVANASNLEAHYERFCFAVRVVVADFIGRHGRFIIADPDSDSKPVVWQFLSREDASHTEWER